MLSEKKFLDEEGLRTYHNGVVSALGKKANATDAVFYVEGNSTVVGSWTGSSDDITEYYYGLCILYKINVEGSTVTTLNINGLGAKTVYRSGITNLTTEYPINSVILLTYVPGPNKLINDCWMVSGDNYQDFEDPESISIDEIDEIINENIDAENFSV